MDWKGMWELTLADIFQTTEFNPWYLFVFHILVPVVPGSHLLGNNKKWYIYVNMTKIVLFTATRI